MLAVLTAAMILTQVLPAEDDRRDNSPFAQRGYYITFMRMPTYDLADWRRIIDGIHDDGGNTLLLWVAGAFRSRKFPITWAYNQEHENVRKDFVRDLIDRAHARGIKVLLGFTPFGYDGVNQYSLEHPETRAIGQDGQPVGKAGIGCWGYNLCPSRPESQRFMREYVREMAFDFYPEADGLMIESSDYAICHCPNCGPGFFEKEFEFVKRISEEAWARKPGATIVVYPHYFSGAEVPGFGVKAAKQPFDSRWTLFFTPHSAHLDPALIRQAKSSLWWDDSPALRRPQDIKAGAWRARSCGRHRLRPVAGGLLLRRHGRRGGPGVAQGQTSGPAGLRVAEGGRPALRRVADAGQPDRLPGIQPEPRPTVRGFQGDPGEGGLRRGGRWTGGR